MELYRTPLNEEPVKPKVDLVNFERHQRQFMNELAMKRTQVEEMKKELDAAKLKIHELTRALDDSRRNAEESQYKLNLALKSVRFAEETLQHKRESVIKTKLQQESAAAERESLQELLQKSEMQNYDLMQKVNELKAQHNCDLAYQKELMDEDAKIRGKIAQLSTVLHKMQAEQSELIRISSVTQTCEELQESVDFYRQEYYKCRQNYSCISEKFVIANSALEKFQALSLDIEDFSNKNETQIIIDQWERATQHFNQNEKLQNEVIDNLTQALKCEKETNTKICLNQAKLENMNDLLQKENEKLKNTLSLRMDRKNTGVQTDSVIKQELK